MAAKGNSDVSPVYARALRRNASRGHDMHSSGCVVPSVAEPGTAKQWPSRVLDCGAARRKGVVKLGLSKHSKGIVEHGPAVAW